MKWLVVLLWLLTGPAFALEPSEMLADPVLEARARALDYEIRCVKCQSEAIASSNADWARDARRAVREQIAAGQTDEQVKTFFVARYGEVVLMDPSAKGINLILWVSGPVMLLVAMGVGFVYVRRRDPKRAEPDLDEAEAARLKEIMNS